MERYVFRRYDCVMDRQAPTSSPDITSTHTSGPTATSTSDREALVAGLRAFGIAFLLPTDADPHRASTDPADLIGRLAASSDPRLRNALATLFVRNGQLGPTVVALVQHLNPDVADEIRRQYTAAVYLQHMWRTRLRLLVPDIVELTDLFSGELQLPDPRDRFGKTGLYALAARSPYNVLASYDTMMSLLFDQLERESTSEFPTAS
jgi:hypothetical protein